MRVPNGFAWQVKRAAPKAGPKELEPKALSQMYIPNAAPTPPLVGGAPSYGIVGYRQTGVYQPPPPTASGGGNWWDPAF